MSFIRLPALARARIPPLPALTVPERLRALVRGSELSLVVLSAVAGVLAGVMVAGITATAQFMHFVLFQLGPGVRLSEIEALPSLSGALVPVLGGLILALIGVGLARLHVKRATDPIEANALHGGRMSMRDSLLVTAQILVSNGFGGSVGLEAGYTQIASGLASRLGTAFRLRRADLRVLLGAGAAGAIAAAFGAPLTGSFYAFELIIGTYTTAGLAPVLTAAIAAVLTSHALGVQPYAVTVGAIAHMTPTNLPVLLVLALICALVGIAVMRGVTLAEVAFRKSRLPLPLHPVVGGLLVGLLALATPHVLSSGHEALKLSLGMAAPAIGTLLMLIVLKAAASAISLGSGFRGGLFFASLFLGALTGRLFAAVMAVVLPAFALDPLQAAVIGMSAMAVGIVGGPLTMSFLALETTSDLPIALAVLAAAVVSAMTVRELFGYSFATWRLHLRGETIRSAHDVGRIRALTVGRLMRRDVRTVMADTRISAFRRDFPLGSTQRVIVTDSAGRYAGIALVPEIHAPELNGDIDQHAVGEYLHYRQFALGPQMNIKDAMRVFDEAESEALAVVEDPEKGNVIGLLTEAHALRRYSEELDRARRDLVGEGA